jgi:hypothetical protein
MDRPCDQSDRGEIGRRVTTRSAALLTIRVIALAVSLFIGRAVGALITQEAARSAPMRPEQAAAAGQGLLLVSLLQALVLAYLIAHSRWRGWRLAVAVFWVLFGVTALQPQIEAAVFMSHVMPRGAVQTHLLSGAIGAALFAPLGVWIMGKARDQKGPAALSPPLVMPIREWVCKLAVIALGYVAIYYAFGHFIAWQNPALREFYTRGRLPSMVVIVPLQIFRGLLWATMAVPVVLMMEGSWRKAALAVGLLFSVVMGALLLLPNPYMPASVRQTHLLEVVTSNFLFGWLLVWVLKR